MELYRRFPKVCLVWCSVEVMIYAGQIFGWSALMYVLKEEGFYANTCDNYIKIDTYFQNLSSGAKKISQTNISTSESSGVTTLDPGFPDLNTYQIQDKETNFSVFHGSYDMEIFVSPTHSTDIKTNKSGKYIPKYVIDETTNTNDEDFVEPKSKLFATSCSSQDSKLNLWFSIAVGFSYIMCAFLGPLMRKIGMRFFRLFFIVIYVIGALCLGFATPVVPWLVCPGLCCIGIAGMALYSTNLQVSFLFLNIQSTITASLVGLFDVSTVIKQLVKIAYYHNISRKTSYISLSVLLVILAGINTFVLLPSIRFETFSTDRKKTYNSRDTENKNEKERFLNEKRISNPVKDSLRQSMCSSQYLLHLFWMSVMALRFVSFIGFLNIWLEHLFSGNKAKETYYLSVFSYTTLGTVVTAITAGLIHDSQRWKFAGGTDYRRKHLPIILPLTVTSLLSMLCTALAFVPYEEVLYVTFILFTFYRSYVYSYEVTFINDAFPLIHFTMLFGILQLFAGLGSMLQYGLFEWFRAYSQGLIHVNIFLLVVEASTLLHPLNIWYQCRKHIHDEDQSSEMRKSIEILVESPADTSRS